MEFVIVFVILMALELIYFRVADKFNIIDKPNERSSHKNITLRGGGIIFYFSVLIYFIYHGLSYPWFFLGLTLMAIISFLDDIFTLSNKIRLLIHFSSVLLLSYELDLFNFPWYYLLITFIIIVGVINAYNFMDGINGITVSYSLSILILLYMVNLSLNFVSQELIIYVSLGVLIFGIFNFRIKAKSFAGDVGSVSIAYILLFLIGLLIMKTGNFIYILLLSVYGIDAVWTIIRRLIHGENIFKAHRSHLYQYLANEAKINKLVISTCYGVTQLIVGILVFQIVEMSPKIQILFALSILCIISVVYLLIKGYIIKKYIKI